MTTNSEKSARDFEDVLLQELMGIAISNSFNSTQNYKTTVKNIMLAFQKALDASRSQTTDIYMAIIKDLSLKIRRAITMLKSVPPSPEVNGFLSDMADKW